MDFTVALTIIRDAWFNDTLNRPGGGEFVPLYEAFDLLDTRLHTQGKRYVPRDDPTKAPKGNLRV